LAQSRCSTASASRPWSRNFENEVWSKIATASRAARCSSPDHANQLARPQEYSSFGATPGGANTFARSQPILLPNTAFLAFKRS
jgi:hypothetical protein